MLTKFLLGLFIFSTAFACTSKLENSTNETPYVVTLPDYFPALPIPDKNPMSNAKVLLGAKLFYDPALSANATISCSTCHLPQLAFTDGREKSIGVSGNPTVRNSPTLINMAYHPYFMFDGGIPTLELQPVAPIMHPDEMGFDLFEAAENFNNNEDYRELSQKAFGEPLNAKNVAYALAAFQRDVLSFQSPYDNYVQGEETALSTDQKRGKALFFSVSLNCAACHAGFNLTNYEFINIGLYVQYADKGREKVTENPSDNGKFKTPTLRNIELTAPYMHDGSMATLDEVIEFKMSGGEAHPNKSDKMHPFILNNVDKKALKEFLISLTDKQFVVRELERKSTL
jgi:cytochrome c peroxidase